MNSAHPHLPHLDPDRITTPGADGPRIHVVTAHVRPRWALPPRLIDQLSRLGKQRTVPAGTVFAHEGDRPDHIHLVLSGRVRGFVCDDDDRRLVLGELGPGEYCGEMLIDGFDRCVSTATVEPSRLVPVPRAAFMQTMSTDNELRLHVLRKLALRVATSTELVRRLALADVRDRVQHFLLEMATARGEPSAAVNISQQAIGDRVGATRSMVNRVIKSMALEGDVELTPDGIVLKRIPRPIALPPMRSGRSAFPLCDSGERTGLPAVTAALLPPQTRDVLLALPADLVAEARAGGRVIRYAPGEYVSYESTPAETLCVVTRGRLGISLTSTNGRSFMLGDLGPGEYFGEMALIEGGSRMATGCAYEHSEVVHLARPALLALLEQRGDFAKHLAVRMSLRLRQLTQMAKQLALLDVQSRTLALLRTLGEAHADGSHTLAQPPSQLQIGERVGASRSMINRVMRDLTDRGVIAQRGGALVIRPEKRGRSA